jgi:putative salt-induced outer membrane protein
MRASWLVIGLSIAVLAFPALAQDDAGEEPAPEPLWEASAGLSYVATTGNTDTMSLGLDLLARRRPTPWGYELFASFNRAEDSGDLTAERYYAGGKAVRGLGERWEVFAGLTGEKDQFAGYDMRLIGSAGATYKVVTTDTVSFSVDGGVTWTDEDVIPPGEDRSYVGGIAGLHFAWAFSETASLTQDLTYFADFDESSAWRLASVTALNASLTDLLGLRLSYEYRYNNRPPLDLEKDDTTTKASVVLKF